MTLKELYKTADYKDSHGMLFHGDCLEIMKNIEDESIDMILCDLPYGTSACKWDSVIPFEPFYCDLITEALKMSIKALDRTIPKKPIALRYLSKEGISWRCRGCHCQVKAGAHHCSTCGQAIDWLAVYEDAKKGVNNETVGN